MIDSLPYLILLSIFYLICKKRYFWAIFSLELNCSKIAKILLENVRRNTSVIITSINVKAVPQREMRLTYLIELKEFRLILAKSGQV